MQFSTQTFIFRVNAAAFRNTLADRFYERASAASERSLFNITEKSQYERPGPTRPGLKRFSEAHISAAAGPIDLRSSFLGSPISSTP